MQNKFAIHIFWSDEDEGFIAICEEFPGLSAFGETREEALTEAQTALSLMIDHYEETGQKLPKPHSLLIAA